MKLPQPLMRKKRTWLRRSTKSRRTKPFMPVPSATACAIRHWSKSVRSLDRSTTVVTENLVGLVNVELPTC